jgi:predicted phospho-2-dehydro-3-deoxyheptonate aldolase
MALLELPDRLLSFFFLRFGGAAVDLDSKIPKGGLTMIGKMIRLERIINRDSHRTVIIPMDHGVTVGPVEGLADMRMTVSKVVAGGANAILMHKGMVGAGHRGTGRDVGLIIHLSAGTSLSPDPNAKQLVCTVEEAIKLGADAVSVHINLGAPTDKEMLCQLGQVSERCLEWQMPLVAMMYTRGPKVKNEFDVNNVKHAARVGAELGADIVKVPYTGSVETFTEVVQGCPVPVVIAGGPKMDSDEDIFKMVEGALEAEAAGVSIGRNAFQHKTPEKMVAALCKMVHEGASVQEAVKTLGS